MNIKTDQLQCYLEGIKVPIKSIKTNSTRNKLVSAEIVIPISNLFVDKMWANAFVQVTYIQEVNGTRREKLLFQGLCKSVTIMETESRTEIVAESIWSSLNSNTTLDYTSPKKYGLKNLKEGLFINVGTEGVVMPEFESEPGYQLSTRYYFLDVGDNNEEEVIKNIGFNDPEAFKLEFIAQRMPYADRYAKVLFEDLAYDNFLLSKVNIERFNLLSKSNERKKINDENLDWLEQVGYGHISGRMFGMTNLFHLYQGTHNDTDQSKGSFNNTINGNPAKEPTNLVDYAANDPRKNYLALCVSKERLWGDKKTCERILQFGEKIADKLGTQVRINDMCCYDPETKQYYSPKMNNGKYHATHNDGASVDIGITGCTNMYENGYSPEKAFTALNILINEVGTRSQVPSVYFNDPNVYNRKELKGMVEYRKGHDNHYHVFMVEREIGKVLKN